MKKALLTAAGLLVLAGCAINNEVPYTDPLYGQANRQAWDQQIAYRESTAQTPEGMAGIHAEKAMTTFNQGYDVKRKQSSVMQIGLTGGTSMKK